MIQTLYSFYALIPLNLKKIKDENNAASRLKESKVVIVSLEWYPLNDEAIC